MDEGRSAERDAPHETSSATLLEARVRGLVLGIAVGEVLGEPAGVVHSGPVPHGVVAQLACFTTDAAVRTSLRSADGRRELHAAYRRWVRAWSNASRPAVGAAGWLDEVPLLQNPAGDAADTVRGLSGGSGGSRSNPVSSAEGWHALARALPLAALVVRDPQQAATLALDSAALTHGPRAWGPSALGVLVAGAALVTGDLVEAVARGISTAVMTGVEFSAVEVVDDAVRVVGTTPASPTALRGVATIDDCASTLWAAVYCTLSYPARSEAPAALALAATAPHPRAVMTLTAALLGAAHGEAALPQGVLTRIDLAYVLDQLARDLVRENSRNADGTWGAGADPVFRARYGVSG